MTANCAAAWQWHDGETLFFELALQDLSRAADLFLPIYQRTATVDGWVSLEVSPLLAHDTEGTVASAKALHGRAQKPNLFIKIPGTPQGLPAIEQAIFDGVSVNVTLLFSAQQYIAAAQAYMNGLERRIEAGLPPDVRSVASLFISRWDRAIAETILPSCIIASGSPSASMPTQAIATLSTAIAGSG